MNKQLRKITLWSSLSGLALCLLLLLSCFGKSDRIEKQFEENEDALYGASPIEELLEQDTQPTHIEI